MGQKGAKLTGDATLSAELMSDRLSQLDGITSKKMFGGYGFFRDGAMFMIIDTTGRAFIKESEDLKPMLSGSEKHGRMPYYSIPDEVLNSPDLLDWVKKATD